MRSGKVAAQVSIDPEEGIHAGGPGQPLSSAKPITIGPVFKVINSIDFYPSQDQDDKGHIHDYENRRSPS